MTGAVTAVGEVALELLTQVVKTTTIIVALAVG